MKKMFLTVTILSVGCISMWGNSRSPTPHEKFQNGPQTKQPLQTILSCEIYDYRGNTCYIDCIQTPMLRDEFPYNSGEEHTYRFKTDKLVTFMVNEREQFILQPGDSLHAVIRYGPNGKPESVEYSGTERATKQNSLRRDLWNIRAQMRYKSQLLTCIVLDQKPADRLRDTYTYLEKADKLIKLEEDGCSPDFLQYLRAETEALAYTSLVEYPPLYADLRKMPIEQQGIPDYKHILDDKPIRDNPVALRCIPYCDFLVLYCFYKKRLGAQQNGTNYVRPKTLEEHYTTLAEFFKGNQRDATLFLILSNYIRNGKNVEKASPFIKEYKEKYNLNREYADILDLLMQ